MHAASKRISVANEDHGHVALPKLYGAPAYARPLVVAVEPVDRPFDPDALPIEAVQTDEERELAHQLEASQQEAGSDAEQVTPPTRGVPTLRGRPFHLRAITGRILGDRDSSER